jgi:5-methylcytosine-specific restriction endonuclease McrA
MKTWAWQVIERDGRCLKCGSTEDLEAHHIKTVDEAPELAVELANGMTLCKSCHHRLHRRKRNWHAEARGGGYKRKAGWHSAMSGIAHPLV